MRHALPILLGTLAASAHAQDALSPTPERVSVVAVFLARPGKEAALRAKLLRMVAPTRAEAGCLSYDLHVNPTSPAQFVFAENWRDEAALDAHMRSPHFVRLITNGTPALVVAPPAIYKGRPLARVVPKANADPRLRSASSLTLLAFFPVRPDKLAGVAKAGQAMVAPTRRERGNVSYDVYQARTDENVIYYVENWASKAALDAHMRTPHFVARVDKGMSPGLAEPWSTIILKRISPPGVGKGAR